MTLARNRVNEVYIEKKGPILRARCRCISHLMQCTILCEGSSISLYHVFVDWANKKSWPEKRVSHVPIEAAFYVSE